MMMMILCLCIFDNNKVSLLKTHSSYFSSIKKLSSFKWLKMFYYNFNLILTSLINSIQIFSNPLIKNSNFKHKAILTEFKIKIVRNLIASLNIYKMNNICLNSTNACSNLLHVHFFTVTL